MKNLLLWDLGYITGLTVLRFSDLRQKCVVYSFDFKKDILNFNLTGNVQLVAAT